METIKVAWQKPELIIISRSTPEEMVLAWCKELGQDYFNGLVGGCAEEEGILPNGQNYCASCRRSASS